MTDSPKVARFRAMHRKGAAFLFPNFWDAGSAKILESLGFDALASSSDAFALTQGRSDYGVTRDSVLEHGRAVAAAVAVPVAADLENGFGPRPEDCAETIRLAAAAGLAGGSIEDTTGDAANPIFEQARAVDRVRAAADAARQAPGGFVLTARADSFLYGKGDLKETIARLQAFEEAGADVLFAPFLPDLDAVAAICSSVSKPVSVMAFGPIAQNPVEAFAKVGVARLSLGPALARLAYGALVNAAEELKRSGRFDATRADSATQATIRKAIAK